MLLSGLEGTGSLTILLRSHWDDEIVEGHGRFQRLKCRKGEKSEEESFKWLFSSFAAVSLHHQTLGWIGDCRRLLFIFLYMIFFPMLALMLLLAHSSAYSRCLPNMALPPNILLFLNADLYDISEQLGPEYDPETDIAGMHGVKEGGYAERTQHRWIIRSCYN